MAIMRVGDEWKWLAFNRDLIEPPDGGYSFIEWEDLTASQRVTIAMKNLHGSFAQFGVSVTGMHKAMEKMASVFEARDWLNAQERLVAAVNPSLASNWARADPGEIAQVNELLARGVMGQETEFSVPVPIYTLVRGNGRVAHPITPGSMSNAITCSEPVEHVQMVRDATTMVAREVRTWTSRVYRKNV